MKKLYAFIVDYKRRNNGSTPSLRKIGEAICEPGKKPLAPSLCMYYIRELQKLGIISDSENAAPANSRWIYYGSLIDDMRRINQAYKGYRKNRDLETLINDEEFIKALTEPGP